MSELAAAYAKQGREKPSFEAYQSLQNDLERDITASDYGFKVSAFVGSVEVLADECVGVGFDYSYNDEWDLLSAARLVWDEYDTTEEVEALAKNKAAGIIANIQSLAAFIK